MTLDYITILYCIIPHYTTLHDATPLHLKYITAYTRLSPLVLILHYTILPILHYTTLSIDSTVLSQTNNPNNPNNANIP